MKYKVRQKVIVIPPIEECAIICDNCPIGVAYILEINNSKYPYVVSKSLTKIGTYCSISEKHIIPLTKLGKVLYE